MMPAAKLMDPVLGIDIHMIQPPGPVPPLPIPHPFIGMLFDPMDLVPVVGATVLINGMPRAIAGSAAKPLPPHIPMGGVFVPPPPGNEGEMFMGSATVEMDGDPASYLALPVLTCQTIGMPAPFRTNPKKKTKMKSLQLPMGLVLPIPMGLPVLVGGPPTIDMMGMAQALGMAALGKAMAKLKKMMKASKKVKKVSDRIHKAANKAMKKLGVPPSVQNKVHKGICTVTGHPVDVATGKVFTDNVDFELPGPIPFKWERTWFSCSTYQGPLGHGWHHSYDMALVEDEKVVAIRLPDGRPAAFPILPVGGEYFNRKEKLTLLRDKDGYAIRNRDRLVFRFSRVPSSKGESPLASITSPMGNKVLFRHSEKGHLEGILDSAGRTIVFQNDSAGRIVAIHAPHPDSEEMSFPIMRFTYDESGDMVKATDALGYSWTLQYKNHLLIKETNRNGLSFRFEYDRNDNQARCIRTWGDGGLYDHKLIYDKAAGTTKVIDSLGMMSVHSILESGLVGSVTNPLGFATKTEYNDFNELIKKTDAKGNSTEYEFDVRGNCILSKGAGGATIESQFVDDLPVKTKDMAGAEWEWVYDTAGRLIKRKGPRGREAEIKYAGGSIASRIDSDGNETFLDYDGYGNLISLKTKDGLESVWEYDRLGRCVLAKNFGGSIQRKKFDLLGRETQIDLPDGNIRIIQYDPEGNPVSVRDSIRSVRFGYSGMGRLTFRDDSGKRLEYEYDTEGRLVCLRNEQGSEYRFELDAAGQVIRESNYDGSIRAYRRDPVGLPIVSIDPLERETRILYDHAGRVVEMTYPTGEKVTYTYRADGCLLEAKNDSATLKFERDIFGNSLKEIQNGNWISSEYDSGGRRISVASSFGIRQAIERDAQGRVLKISASNEPGTAPDEAWQTIYKRDFSETWAEQISTGGIKTFWKKDSLGRPLTHTIAGGDFRIQRNYSWGYEDRLEEFWDSRWGTERYSYDQGGRLNRVEFEDGSHLFSVPDAVENLFRSPDKNDRRFGAAGELLEATTPKGVKRYSYDQLGNLTERIDPDGSHWKYSWNSAGKLSKVTRPDGTLVEFAYDPMGRRISKTHQGRKTCWLWDNNTPIHEWVEESETNPIKTPDQGTRKEPVTWVFEPSGFTPIARLTKKRQCTVVSDQIGTPLMLVDRNGKQAWSARLTSHGEFKSSAGERRFCPFRMPGQYEDSETGLYYNRFRYYDPEAGQYVSRDPIGLAGGLRQYSYVRNPNSQSDPFGLTEKPPEGIAFVGNKDPRPAKFDENGKRIGGDIEVTDGQVKAQQCDPEKGIWPDGKSATDRPTKTPLTGQVNIIDQPTNLPEGVAIVEDGKNVGGPHSAGHHTVYPTRDMSMEEFTKKVNEIDTRNPGKIDKKKGYLPKCE